MPGLRVNARLDNTRGTIRREANIVLGIVGDVRGRFGRSAMEPRVGRSAGGLLGHRGSLAKAPAVFVVGTVDNVAQHVQGFAKINRSQLR